MDDVKKPGMTEASLWMGTDLFALLRTWSRGGFRVAPRHWLDGLIDLSFATANTAVRSVQNVACGRAIGKVDLPEDPVFVLGHWRTGTTMLHEILSLDPRHRAPTTYECFVANHFVVSQRWLKGWSGFALPGTRPPDNMQMGWDLPQEDEFALCNRGAGSIYEQIAFPNRQLPITDTLELDNLSTSDRARWSSIWTSFLREVLYQREGRLVLKSPTHTFRLPWLVQWFPQARFIYLMRDPADVIPSTIRLWNSLFATQGYHKRREDAWSLESFVLDLFVRMHERFESTVAQIPDDRLVRLRFDKLTQDTRATVADLYQQLELGPIDPLESPLTEYLEMRADYQKNRHSTAPELQSQIQQRCADYARCNQFSA